ncbi:hypothetical protein CB1_000516007 [Camelus ferus]|nr:hypothetical protein CB1_000516007 [Camelus ferus]
MLIYSHIIRTVEAKRNSTFVGSGYTTPFCQSVQKEQRYSAVFSSAMVIRDLLFVVLIVWSSIYMVNLLYKHRQRARHLHSPSLSFRTSPEIKATHTILLLIPALFASVRTATLDPFPTLLLVTQNCHGRSCPDWATRQKTKDSILQQDSLAKKTFHEVNRACLASSSSQISELGGDWKYHPVEEPREQRGQKLKQVAASHGKALPCEF